jgi:hypothetical protein
MVEKQCLVPKGQLLVPGAWKLTGINLVNIQGPRNQVPGTDLRTRNPPSPKAMVGRPGSRN